MVLSIHQRIEVYKRALDHCAMKVDSVPLFLRTVERPSFPAQLWTATLLWETRSLVPPLRITIVLVISPVLQTANPKTYWAQARATRKICSHWISQTRMLHQQLRASRCNKRPQIQFRRDHQWARILVSSQKMLQILINYLPFPPLKLTTPQRIEQPHENYKSLRDLKRD